MLRNRQDSRKQDLSPSLLDFGPVVFYLPRHFGFCYGVENAIELSYKVLEEYADTSDRNVYLVSQIIHNQHVNEDLIRLGARFIMDTEGNLLVPWEQIKKKDVVVIPAFGVPLEVEEKLAEIGMETTYYDATCPFVKKVWNRSEQLGMNGCTVVIHGKSEHEESRATFSRSVRGAPTVFVRNVQEARQLGDYIAGRNNAKDFYTFFKGRYSSGFDSKIHLKKIGVINQTTMLASETHDVMQHLRDVMAEKYGNENIKDHFADTRDTLCYATNDNQDATYELLKTEADLAIVVGGYNSSNTLHITSLCEQKFPTYFIDSESRIIDQNTIIHYDYRHKEKRYIHDFLPQQKVVKVILTSGASCPDTLIDKTILKILQMYDTTASLDEVLAAFN